MATTVRIDEDECIGCETCVELCPDVFVFDADAGKAQVRDDAADNADCAEEAAGSCPAACITVERA